MTPFAKLLKRFAPFGFSGEVLSRRFLISNRIFKRSKIRDHAEQLKILNLANFGVFGVRRRAFENTQLANCVVFGVSLKNYTY